MRTRKVAGLLVVASISMLLRIEASTLFGQDALADHLPSPDDTDPLRFEPFTPDQTSLPATSEIPGIRQDLEAIDDWPGGGQVIEVPAPPSPLQMGYNPTRNSMSWLVGDGDIFGIFSIETFPTIQSGENSGIGVGIGIHWLGGPLRTDMPPHLFDFRIAYQKRHWLTCCFGYDLAFGVGAFSDFEGSARKGVRFPGHGVVFYKWDDVAQLVLGVEVLDRDDIRLLPVAGVIFSPSDCLQMQLVFPRPRIDLRFSDTQSLFVGAELGGGTWAIERVTQAEDVATYRDIRLSLGIAKLADDDGPSESTIEIAYVFARNLSYRSGFGDYEPDDTVMLRVSDRF